MKKTSFIPPPYPPCVQPLSLLRKTMIKELRLETQHRGIYLIVRIVTPEDNLNASMAIVEDEAGDVLLVQLYLQNDGLTGEKGDILLEGAVLLLKDH